MRKFLQSASTVNDEMPARGGWVRRNLPFGKRKVPERRRLFFAALFLAGLFFAAGWNNAFEAQVEREGGILLVVMRHILPGEADARAIQRAQGHFLQKI